MKTKKIAVLGIVLSTFVLFVKAYQVEGGDTNAVLMYLVIFLFPVILLAILNAFYLFYVDKFLKGILKIMVGFVPILIMAMLNFLKTNILPFIDGDSSSLGLVSTIGLGVTSIIWAFKTMKK